ncbi:MAG: DMT family transporter, partial [Patescibacteria group bacterium]|nr:DMT family transporter [Patescibacteria group bacterium]
LRRALGGIPSTIIVTIEHSIRVLILLPLLPRFIKEYKKLTKKDWLLIFAIALFSGALGSIFYTAALAKVNNISYSVVVLLQQIQPIFTVALAAMILKEKITPRYITFAAIALISAYFLTFPQFKPQLAWHNGELIAAFLAIGAAVMWGSTTILSKLILKKLSFAAAVTIRFIMVIPISFSISLILGDHYSLSLITPTQWQYLLILSVVTGVFGYIAYYMGLKHTEAKIATFSEFAWPVSAALIGFFVLGERLTGVQIFAAFILILDILALSLFSNEKTT